MSDLQHGLEPLPIGEVIGGYRISKELGRGGFGIVYLGHIKDINKYAAIKEFFPSTLAYRSGTTVIPRSDGKSRAIFEKVRDKFVETCGHLNELSHSNIVKVLGFERRNDTAYMIMDYVDGITIKEWREKLGRRPTYAEIRGIFEPIFRALAYMHGHPRRLIHRDVSPINIMIRRDGVPILIDFGTMKQTLGEEIAAQGDSGQVSIPIFNPLWAAPEQLRAEGAKHGPFTDVYAAAACMYYMLSGQAPVSAAQRQDDVAFNKPDPYKPLITVNQVAEVPAEVLSAVDRALAFMPEKRTPNIETFLQELRWQEGASVEAGIAINVLAAANGVVGKPYSGFNAVISGGSPPYRLNVSGLPRGIEASIADGGRIALSGTPRDFGHYGFTIDVNDDRARTGSVHSRIYIERASSNFLWLIGGVIAALIVAAAGIAHFTSRTERAAVSAGQPSAPQSAGTSGTQTASAPSNVTSPPINPPSTVSPELVAFNSAASCIDRENPCRTAALQDCLAGFNRQYASSSFSERLTARAKEHLETCTLPDGIYTGIRSWDNPKPPVCKASYAFTAVIRNGRISFTDDGLTGEGAVNQDTGFVTIENDGFRTADTGAPTRFTTYVRGSYEGAQMFNGNCRTGTFVINRSSFRPS